MDFEEFKAEFSLKPDPQQEAAIVSSQGPVMLLAVPGSGKTTVLVSRLGYMLFCLGIRPESILTMTYTVAAAGDMRRRFISFFGGEAARGLEFRTINGVCAKIIRLYEQKTGRSAFELMSDTGRRRAILSELCRRQSREYSSDSTLNSLETAISYAKNQMLSGEELDSVRVEGLNFPGIFREYGRILKQNRLMDYDDQMVYARQILLRCPELLRELQQRWQYFCVDEAQDSSRIQHEIISILASAGRNIFMVGDEDQSIYGFRAAFPQALTEFERRYPGAKILYMENNYRSTREIVAAADRFIQKNTARHPKHMQAVRDSGPEIRAIQVYDRQQQFNILLNIARDCRSQTAVLYRDNDSALPVIDLLCRSGIAYRTRQLNSAFFTNRVVRDICDIIRFALSPRDGELFMGIYYKLSAGISREAAEAAVSRSSFSDQEIMDILSESSQVSPWTRRQCSALRSHLKNLLTENAGKAVYRIVHFMGYGEFMLDRGLDSGRAEILEALGSREESPEGLLSRLEQLREIVEQGPEEHRDCPFILSTIHASKGLEYDRVILADVIDGILPSGLPETGWAPEEQDSYQEERRLFYVGMTRAKRQLDIFRFTKPGIKSSFSDEIFSPPAAQMKKERRGRSPIPALLKKQELKTDKTAPFVPGAAIRHSRFGPGRIAARSGDIISVVFPDSSLRRLSLRAALRSGQLRLRSEDKD